MLLSETTRDEYVTSLMLDYGLSMDEIRKKSLMQDLRHCHLKKLHNQNVIDLKKN